MLTVKLRRAYYFGVTRKCNFFVAEGIVQDSAGLGWIAGGREDSA